MQDGTPNGGKRVLLAEDQAVIAMMMEQELADLGLDVVGPFSTCAAAADWLSRHTPDFAVLDVNLRDGPCTDLAVELQRRGVKFAVFSGTIKLHAPPELAAAPWFEKPSGAVQLIALLAEQIQPFPAPLPRA
jgi:DNA-binding NtrC family response regulator